MNPPISIRRASLEDMEALVELRLALQLESGHLTQDMMVAALRQATQQYLMKALPKETFIAWVAEAQGRIVASSGLIFFQKPPSEKQSIRVGSLYLEYVYTPSMARTGNCYQALARTHAVRQTDRGTSDMDVCNTRWQGHL